MYEQFGWSANNMFFLTRDVTVGNPYEITSLEDVTQHSQQYLSDTNNELDAFGRGYLDKMFIRLCGLILDDNAFTPHFKLLSCKKEDDKYIIRVEFTDETLEMEMLEMICYFKQKSVQKRRESGDDALFTRFGCNAGNMFFITRDLTEGNPYEITSLKDVLRHGNQCLFDTYNEEDAFGRNYVDKMFIHLCLLVWGNMQDTSFDLLSCKKEGDRYIISVKFDKELLEMELLEMVRYFEQKGKNEAVT